jgi:cupin 2 domain-containing protein
VAGADGNLFAGVATDAVGEVFSDLFRAPGLKIERIVSTGQISPPGFWYDQGWAEWVLVVAGAAALEFEGEHELRHLSAGDYLLISPGRRHRVAWTDPAQPTIWLAIHAGELPD